ncbi:MAG: biotin--[acetyl-CoA-carboxylase] ligase [Desulforhopalus sp.]|nr:biotin--[acetyl-CoA-carboxylase] ligase [Desulforhopalus sp.]
MYKIHFFDSLPSTNDLAKKYAGQGAPHGTAIIAARQTKGRGRLGKTWHSTPGKGLFCSIIVRPDLAIVDYPKITLTAGLAVAIAVERITGASTQLKWPNDIFINGRKCGGILTESSSLNEPIGTRYAVVGIGLNLNSREDDFPDYLRGTVTSLFLETGICHDVRQVFSAVHAELLVQIETFVRNGFQPVLSLWKLRDFLLGKRMECVSLEGKRISGVSLGPDSEGQLHIKVSDGQIHTVLSGDVRLAHED